VKVPGAISILPGLLAAIVWVCMVNKVPPIRIRSAFLDRGVIPMLLLVLAIIIFQGTLVESKAVFQMRDELTAYQVRFSRSSPSSLSFPACSQALP